jgi:arsenate reductase
MISKKDNLINLYYHPNHLNSKKCIAVANANKAVVQAIDIEKTRISQTHWSEMAEMLNISVIDLLDLEHDVIISKFGRKPEIDEFSALKIIQNNPEVIKAPIALRGQQAVFAKNSRDILKLQNSDTGDIRIP